MINGVSIQPRFSELEKEIQLLRSFLIGVAGKDKEGNYKPEFVKKILRTNQEEGKFIFRDKKSFLSCLQK